MRAAGLRNQRILDGEVPALGSAGVSEYVHCGGRYANRTVKYGGRRPRYRPSRAGQHLHEPGAVLDDIHVMHRRIVRGSRLECHQAGDSCAFNWRDKIGDRRDIVAVDGA